MPETCWESIDNKHLTVASCWFSLSLHNTVWCPTRYTSSKAQLWKPKIPQHKRSLPSCRSHQFNAFHKIHTPRSTALPQKLTGAKPIKKFLVFYGTPKFITAITNACQLSLSWTRSIQSMPPSYSLKIYINIIIPSTSGSSKWAFCSTFPHQNPVYTSPLHHTRYMSRPSHSSRFYHPNNIWWAVQIIKLLIMQFSPLPCYLVPLRPKYSSQHPFLTRSTSCHFIYYAIIMTLIIIIIITILIAVLFQMSFILRSQYRILEETKYKKTALFWVITQRSVVISFRCSLVPGDGTDRLSVNVGKKLAPLVAQRPRRAQFSAAGAWNCATEFSASSRAKRTDHPFFGPFWTVCIKAVLVRRHGIQ